MNSCQTAVFQNLSTLCIQSSLHNFSRRRKPKHRLRLSTIRSAHIVRKIDYPGSNNRTEFTFDCLGFRAKIVEITAGSITSTKQFLAGSEERDVAGALTKRFFESGQMNGSNAFYYTKNGPLGSVSSMSDVSGVLQSVYLYSPYGIATKTLGSVESDFQFCSYYFHERSKLNFTLTRAYNPVLGRFFSRDSLLEQGGFNLYSYAANNPFAFSDPTGLEPRPRKITCNSKNPEYHPGCYNLSLGAVQHIAQGHRPTLQPWALNNSEPRGIFSFPAWDLLDNLIEIVLCRNDSTIAPWHGGLYSVSNFVYVAHTTYGVQTARSGIGTVYEPNSSYLGPFTSAPARQLTVIMDFRNNDVITAFPGGPFGGP